MNTKLKYFLYARKSSEGEDRQITSIEDQISEVEKLSKELNLEIVDIISESKSAKKPGRIEFNKMLSRIEKGEAQGILCWKLNRLARNPIDGGRISWLLQNNIIQHIQTYGRDYKPSDNVLMMSVEFGMSNQFVKDLSVDVKRGMRKKAERGWFPISKLPIGYIHNPIKTDSTQIIKDELRYDKVKKLWKLYLTGMYSVSDIKRKADEMNLHNHYGNPYSINTFYNTLKNEFYYGYFSWTDENGIKKKYSGKHIPMITELQYLKAQKLLNKTTNSTQNQRLLFTYRGLISCGECNGFVTAENKHQAICTHCKKKFSLKTRTDCPQCGTELSKMKKPSIIDITYYHCTKKVNKSCTQGSITEKNIEKFFEKQVSEITISKDFYDFALKGLKRLEKEETQDEVKSLISMKKRRTELSKRFDNLFKMRADGEITAEQLQQMKSNTQKEYDEVNLSILSIENVQKNWLNLTKEQFDYMLQSVKKFKNADKKLKKELVHKIGSNLTLLDKSLYFKRDLALTSIIECSKVYTKEKSRLEPENHVGIYSDFDGFNLLFTSVCTHLKNIRTCQIAKFLDNE